MGDKRARGRTAKAEVWLSSKAEGVLSVRDRRGGTIVKASCCEGVLRKWTVVRRRRSESYQARTRPLWTAGHF